MTPGEWAAVLSAAALVLGALAKIMAELSGLRKKVDAVHHETQSNSGTSMRDAVVLEIKPQVEQLVEIAAALSDRMDRSEAAAVDRRADHDRRLDAVEKGMRGVQRDVGRVADGMVQLGQVDLADRQAAADVHADYDRRLGALERHPPRT